MDIRSRIIKGRLLEEMTREPTYSEKLGLSDLSSFQTSPVPSPELSEMESALPSADSPHSEA